MSEIITEMTEKEVVETPAEKPAKRTRKTAAKAVEKVAEKAAKTVEKAAEKATRRSRPPLTPELYVECNGKQFNITDVVERAKAAYREDHKVGVQSCKVYVKPEDNAAYYVVNKVEGKLDL